MKFKTKKNNILALALLGTLILSIGAFFIFKKDASDITIETEEIVGVPVSLYSLDIGEDGSVITTGRVEAAQQADLSFVSGGNIESVSVKIGSKVGSGQILATLDAKDEIASVTQAQAQLQLARVELENTKARQRAAVSASSNDLTATNLEAYLTEDSLDKNRSAESAPVISGNYASSQEGTYFLEVYSSSQSSGYSFRYSGLESGIGAVSTVTPTPLGTRGLYIKWSSTEGNIANSEWEVPIPNYRSAQYVSSENQLDQAVVTQSTAIKSQEAQVKIAEAGLSAANARLESKRLRAPFSGTVTDVSKGLGESIGGGQNVVSLVSNGQKIIEVTLSSRASQFVSINDSVLIDNLYVGKVAAIAPSISGNTGVRGTIEITDNQASQILVGSVVSIKINTKIKSTEVGSSDTSQDLVPLSSVVSRNGGYAVYTIENSMAVEIPVEVGKISGNLIEIRGLSDRSFIIRDAFSIRAGDIVEVTEE